mmetsp:Transcript_32070/g.61718  ORF Transcript_32070/g.61718 Transcript_32070/m.61718 type:complete len:142 (-) Transcript_32070:458-883(-)
MTFSCLQEILIVYLRSPYIMDLCVCMECAFLFQLREGGVNLDLVANLASVEFAETPESVTECSVCLDEFQTGDRLTALPCGHHFHPHCIRRALRGSSRCPYCRFQVPRGFAHINDYSEDENGPPDTGDESDDELVLAFTGE